VEYGHKVSVGYYDQEQEYLDESKSILEEVLDSNPQLTLTQARNMLASFLFKEKMC
jgi:ATP-binding cassette subfamily F protein 3